MEPQERIKDLAKTRFFSLGLTPVTMDKLAYDLGMSKKTLYVYYKSKDELLKQIIREYVSEIKQELQTIQQKVYEPLDQLREIWIFGGRTYLNITPHFKQDLKRFHPDLWQELEKFNNQHLFETLKHILAKCIERSMVHTSISPELILNVYLNGLLALPSEEGNIHDENATVQTVFDLIFLGVLNDTSRGLFKYHSNNNKSKKEVVFKRVELDNRD